MTIRRAEERGHSHLEWLDSRHSFSFGEYHDPQQMGHSALRVINDDRVVAGAGFGTHGHRDMEIISCVLEGVIAHKDSEGNIAELRPGEFQLMSAGSGIRHSEFNPSSDQPLHFLQIWIQPNVFGEAPSYQQKHFAQGPGLTLIASPDGAAGSMVLKQNARMYQLVLEPQCTETVLLSSGRKGWVQLISGDLAAGAQLSAGDGVAISVIEQLNFVAGDAPVRALVFDLP